jgi:hypothetical protein
MKYIRLNPSFPNEQEEKYWLIRVTINESISLTRKAYRRKKASLDHCAIYNSQKEDHLIDLVRILPEKYKSVIILLKSKWRFWGVNVIINEVNVDNNYSSRVFNEYKSTQSKLK